METGVGEPEGEKMVEFKWGEPESMQDQIITQGWKINDLAHRISDLEKKEWEDNELHSTAKRHWYEKNIEQIRYDTGKTTSVYYCGDGCPACEQEYRKANGISLLPGDSVGCCGHEGLHWRECG